ncbi:MAG: hypothetical protein NZ822_03205, partial [Patescibacteria group bacterium]|nr:hypothetical protein [Patescibacteria group bacterium]
NIAKIQSLKEAIEYEIKRQIALLIEGKEIKQETRGWDEIRKITYSQRHKEEAEDYRYFPEPDLPPLIIDEEILTEIIEVETPWDKKERLTNEYQLSFYEANILVKNGPLADFFEESFSELFDFIKDREVSKKLIINYLINDLIGLIQKNKISPDEIKISAHEFAHLLREFHNNKISSKILKEAIEKAIQGEIKIEEFLREREKISDVEILTQLIKETIEENQKTVYDYHQGKKESFEYLIGQLMKKSKGRADPGLIRELLAEFLDRMDRHQ